MSVDIHFHFANRCEQQPASSGSGGMVIVLYKTIIRGPHLNKKRFDYLSASWSTV
jgi:hypothetical protein